jgi:hypothetical protein
MSLNALNRVRSPFSTLVPVKSFIQVINVKQDIVFKRATLYEHEVIKKQKFYSLAEAFILIQHVVRQS